MFKNKTGRPRRSLAKWARIAVAGGAAAVGLGTVGVTGAFAGHATLGASIGCTETAWTLNFTGEFFAASFVNLVRIRLLDGPAEALAQVPAAGYWDFPSTPVPNPPDPDHAVTGPIAFSLNFPQTTTTVALMFQIHFVDLHIGAPGPPIEHPDTEEVQTFTRTQNCFVQETTTTTTVPTTGTTLPPPPPVCEETTTTGAGSATTTPGSSTPPSCTTTVPTTQPPLSQTLPPTGSNTPIGVMAGGLVSLSVGALAIGTTRRRAHKV